MATLISPSHPSFPIFISPQYFNRNKTNFQKSKPQTLTPIPISHHHKMLPYATIHDAETALNRSLTATETIWFNYTVNKSDYNLYLHNILFLFIIFTIVPLFYILIEIVFHDYVDRYKIQPKVRFSVYDNFKCYFDVMWMFILVVGPLQFVSYPSIQVSFE